MKTKATEDEQCFAFAQQLQDSPTFVAWLLERTCFQPSSRDIRVLWQEQKSKRYSPLAPWWRHWFTSKCLCPGCVGGRETDIFVVFESANKERFALHIENKLLKSRFTAGQAEAYGIRARCWQNQSRFLNYALSQTMLLAPASFALSNPDARLFDVFVSHEELAMFCPLFADNIP